MSGFALVEEGEEGCLFCANVATISACPRYNYRSFRQESRTYPIGHQWQCDSSGDLSCLRGAAGHSQTLCEALPGAWSSGLFCTCQEAIRQQIDCGSLPTGSRLIGPRTDCARSGSGGGDFVQYLAQGNPRGSSAAWKKKIYPTMR